MTMTSVGVLVPPIPVELLPPLPPGVPGVGVGDAFGSGGQAVVFVFFASPGGPAGGFALQWLSSPLQYPLSPSQTV